MIKKSILKKFRNEVQKNWDLPEEKLLNKLDKQFEKLSEPVYELSLSLQFILRYIEINKHHFESKEGIFAKVVDEKEIPLKTTPTYNPKYKTVWEWVIRKHISIWKEFTLGILIAMVEVKEWIDQEYEISFLEESVKDIENQLENKDHSAENIFYRLKTNNAVFEINKQFKAGNYPNVFTTDSDIISTVEAMIAFKKYLQQRITSKRPPESSDHFSIQGEIKGEKDSMGNLTIHLPLKEIEKSLVEELKKSIGKVPSPVQDYKLKFYTRVETAKMLGISTVTLDKWVKQGKLPVYRIGNKPIRIKREDIEKLLVKIGGFKFKLDD
jgi:excisionase family DNA binding protein